MPVTYEISDETKKTIALLLPGSEVGQITASCVVQDVLFLGFSPEKSTQMTGDVHRKLFPRAVAEQITAGLDVGYALASEIKESGVTT